MISVDNSAEKRVFHLTKYEKKANFIQLKNEIIKNIEDKNYFNLAKLIKRRYSSQFSLFIFYKKIQKEIKKIRNVRVRKKLRKLNWYKILVGNITEIRQIISSNKSLLFEREHYKYIFENLYKNELSGKDELKKQFFNLFEDLNVCPYCNRNFVNPIYKENSVGADNKNQSPDIEHFFPKSIYPFLSLSISNLLPSCTFCNKIKSDVDTYKHNCLSPYEVKNSDFKFDFSLELNQVKKVKLISKIDCKNSEILHLESLYNEVHRKYINDIFDDILKYPRTYKDSLKKKFKLNESDYKELFRNYHDEKDFNKQPLSKMTKDLYNQIKNLKGDKS
jgi:hypothetical protein